MQHNNGNILFEREPRIAAYAAVVGKKEGEGPLRESFDRIIHDSYAGQDTFEQAESELMHKAVEIALGKRALSPAEIDVAFCGDLLNQCVASSFAMRSFGMPYAGIYGACSTMALGLIMAASAVESGAANRALCAVSSHYCTAERQYRFPLEYGSQRPPTAQWTVTGSGACVLESPRCAAADSARGVQTLPSAGAEPGCLPYQSDPVPHVSAARIGKIVDYQITDQNNMGAAMAPAIVKTGTKRFSTFFVTLSVRIAEKRCYS